MMAKAMAMAKPVSHSHHLLVLLFFLAIHHSLQLQQSQSQTLLIFQKLLGYPSALSSFTSIIDFCNIEPTTYLTIICYEGNITQLHVVGNNGSSPLAQNFSSDSLFATLASLPSLKVLSIVSMGLWGPIPESISQLTSLEILNISSNHFSGVIPTQLSLLRSLQSLVLDDNDFTGEIPMLVGSLQGLAVLSMRKNLLIGSVPTSVNALQTLRVLDLSNNQLNGDLPDLSNLKNLQVLHLENNTFGPHFPSLPTKLVSLVLRNNSFRFGIPSNLSSYYQLEKLDLSLNGFVGPFIPSLLSLPSIKYLDISANTFTGMLFSNSSCNSNILFVNLSSNLLKGELPTCLKPKNRVIVVYARNCFSNADRDQHPANFCQNEALAVNIIPHEQNHRRRTTGKAVLVSSMGGIVGGALIFGVVFLVIIRVNKKGVVKAPSGSTLEQVMSQMNDKHEVKTPTRSIMENIISRVPMPYKDSVKTLARSMMEHVISRIQNRRVKTPTRSIVEHVSSVNTAKLLTDARYISQTMKMGASLPAYRTFALEEIKEATNNFDVSCFISEGSRGQIYKGVLSDGTQIAVRSLKMKKRHGPQTYMHHIELISKLRHSHLVSALGHSFECNQDDPSVSSIFLIFEFAPYRSLRGCISVPTGSSGQKLSWAQRIAAAIGVVKGIQFLHTGIVPGLYSNNLKITDILLDNNLNVKISSYNIPLLAENKVGNLIFSPGVKGNVQARLKDGDKNDVYDFGVILLEIVLGRTIMFHHEVGTLKDLLQVSIVTDDIARRSIVDPAVHKECSDESLQTVMEICVRCLSEDPTDRPSVEDVLWNLQFAAQVQNSWRRDSNDIRESPASSSHEI